MTSGALTDPAAHVVDAAREIGPEAAWPRYFGHHSKSFRFAAWLFPRPRRRAISGVYAFCRFTDDLVDETEADVDVARQRVEAWRTLARAAYEGGDTGIPLLDVVMGRMAAADAPFHYVDDLLDGVAMDLEPLNFETLEDLYVYTYRVAGVVGGWITEQFGLHDPDLLDRAYSLGHAMQLTNILRDVGEDWRRDRLYLPRRMLDEYGVGVEVVGRVSTDGGPVPAAYGDLVESLMLVADHHYHRAFEAIPALPRYYARPVAVAARVYQGIHDVIRENHYDNGRLRAYTTLWRKVGLGWGALRELSSHSAVTDTRLGLADG
ncbi:MAG TPA: phytoene/squalene synthase family protein [Longimicrobiales bacterium]|nr:phytoene/squalene synthase family protein [Longimicrobiales bacterium]